MRTIMIKGDGSVLIHSDGGSYKPLNWMSPPCVIDFSEPDDDLKAAGVRELWRVTNTKTADMLVISVLEIHHDSTHELGDDPGLIKDGVESDLQRLSAAQIEVYGEGFSLIRREYPTAIGPVDILARDAANTVVAIEIKRRGDIDGVEQLTRYLELLNRDATISPVSGIFAAQEIKPQARTLAEDRGIRCVILDLEELRGGETDHDRLF